MNKLKKYTKNKQGFTLIELLVVVAIIGILATIALSSLNQARAKARDAQKISSIKSMETALELYYLDNDKYPGGTDLYFYGYSDTTLPCGYEHVYSPEGAWCDLEALLSLYIPSIPRGTTSGLSREYVYKTNGTSYGLSVLLESPGSSAQNDGGFYEERFEVGPIVGCTDWLTWDGSVCLD